MSTNLSNGDLQTARGDRRVFCLGAMVFSASTACARQQFQHVLWDGGNEKAYSIERTSDGGYIIAGNRELTPNVFGVELKKTDAVGNLVWTHLYSTPAG